MIKIIGGKYRSRNILTPEVGTIPTKNRVREALMSSLCDLLPGATVLDLFAGSGALGIESLSRGADKAYFVDSNPKAIEIIKNNLKTLGETNQEVYLGDFKAFLSKDNLPKFDIVYLDPPYANKDAYQEAVEMLIKGDLLSEYGAVVAEYEGGIYIDLSAFMWSKEYTYGKSKLLIGRKKK